MKRTSRSSSKVLVSSYGSIFSLPLKGWVRMLMTVAEDKTANVRDFGGVELGEAVSITDLDPNEAAGRLLKLDDDGVVKLTKQQRLVLQEIVKDWDTFLIRR